MSNLTPLQEAMNRAHSDNGRSCLPNCWRSHYGDKPRTIQCNFCKEQLPLNDTPAHIAHNEWHLANPESIVQ